MLGRGYMKCIPLVRKNKSLMKQMHLQGSHRLPTHPLSVYLAHDGSAFIWIIIYRTKQLPQILKLKITVSYISILLQA